MAEYISRDDLLNVINANVAEAHNERCSQLLEAILNAPTADVAEVKHGEWEDLYNGRYDNPLYVCSKCNCRALRTNEKDELGHIKCSQELSPCCPHCGAKMDGGVMQDDL